MYGNMEPFLGKFVPRAQAALAIVVRGQHRYFYWTDGGDSRCLFFLFGMG